MTELTANQFDLVVNAFSLTMTVMGVAAIFFLVQRAEVLPRYRLGVTLLGLMGVISAYSYHQLYASWTGAYALANGAVRASGATFNENFRYIDWLLTLPLLLVAFIQVLNMPARQARVLNTILTVLAVEMVVLGYPGAIATSTEARWLWWGIAMVPALIIVYQLYIGLSATIAAEAAEPRRLARRARLLVVVGCAAYPVFYLLPLFGMVGSTTYTGVQVGYAVADLVTKAVYGVMVYRIAAAKSVPVDETMQALRTVKI